MLTAKSILHKLESRTQHVVAHALDRRYARAVARFRRPPPPRARSAAVHAKKTPAHTRYEAEFNPSQTKQSEETAHLNQFILHSAMDMVDAAMEERPDMRRAGVPIGGKEPLERAAAVSGDPRRSRRAQVSEDRRQVQRSECVRVRDGGAH